MATDLAKWPMGAAEGRDSGLGGFRLEEAPGHLLRRAQQRHLEIFVEEVGADGPTPRQFAALLTVCQRPGLTQTELVRATGIDRSTVGDMLDRLVRRGLVERRRVDEDGRANALHATEAGRRLAAQALAGVARAQARILAPLPSERHGEALAMLRLLAGLG
jgi:DNA-binding MarR family transcriptional regulator